MIVKRLLYLLPILAMLLLMAVLFKGLSIDPRKLPSAIVNKPAPAFLQPYLKKDKVSLVSVWASWCGTCVDENKLLLQLKTLPRLNLIGLNYKDEHDEAKAWLRRYGDPYNTILYDDNGQHAIDLGVYVTPALYVIDTAGIVRYRHAGPIGQSDWETIIEPLLHELKVL